jgi:taurine dioxygenase
MSEPVVRPLSQAGGCVLSGIDLNNLSDDGFSVIEHALHEHLVLVVRDQKLTPDRFVDFSRRFGKPEPHVIDQFHHADDANILVLSNRRDAEDKPLGLADGSTHFTPTTPISTYRHAAPSFKSSRFRRRCWHNFRQSASGIRGLTGGDQRRIAPLICRHRYGNRDDHQESRTAASPLNVDQNSKMHWVRHPLVRIHPKTGRKALYAVSGSSLGIEGMDDREGVLLLDELKVHATDPLLCFTPKYRPGDVVVWDNCTLLHRAPLIAVDRPRTLWRITVKEDQPTLPF